jgi:hypothetical protein
MFYEISHLYNNLFLSNEGVSKGHKNPFIYE